MPKGTTIKQWVEAAYPSVYEKQKKCMWPLPRYLNYYFYVKNIGIKTKGFCNLAKIKRFHFCYNGKCPNPVVLYNRIQKAGGMTDKQILQFAKMLPIS